MRSLESFLEFMYVSPWTLSSFVVPWSFCKTSLPSVFEISREYARRMRSLENVLEFTRRLRSCEADDKKSRRISVQYI